VRTLDGHPTDEIFSHTDEDGVTRHWNTSAMVRAVFERKVKPAHGECDINGSLVAHILSNHGVEEANLAQLPDKVLDIPVVLAQFTDGTSLLIDGNHRVVKRWRKGLKKVHAMIFSEEQWKPFLLTDVDREYKIEEVGQYLTRLLEKPQ
jgi:hypothetical protein